MNRQKINIDNAEREIAKLLSQLTGHEIERALSAGIPNDVGDLIGLPDFALQVTHRNNEGIGSAYLQKPRDIEVQRRNKGAKHAATLIKHPKAKGDVKDKWRVVMTLDQFVSLIK